VREIRIREESGAFRVIYLASRPEALNLSELKTRIPARIAREHQQIGFTAARPEQRFHNSIMRVLAYVCKYSHSGLA